jgi:hypothetical protein
MVGSENEEERCPSFNLFREDTKLHKKTPYQIWGFLLKPR